MPLSNDTAAIGNPTAAPSVVVGHYMRQQGFEDCAELGLTVAEFGEWGLAFGPLTKSALVAAARTTDLLDGERGRAIEKLHQIRLSVMGHSSNLPAARRKLEDMGINLIDPETGAAAKRDVVVQILTAALALLVGPFDLVERVRSCGVYRS